MALSVADTSNTESNDMIPIIISNHVVSNITLRHTTLHLVIIS